MHTEKFRIAKVVVEILAIGDATGADLIYHTQCSPNFFYQISRQLVRAGLIKARRGPGARYSLLKPLKLRDLTDALNSKLPHTSLDLEQPLWRPGK